MSQTEGGNRADGGNGGNFANFAVAGRLGARREARALVLKDTGRPRRFRKWGGVTWGLLASFRATLRDLRFCLLVKETNVIVSGGDAEPAPPAWPLPFLPHRPEVRR